MDGYWILILLVALLATKIYIDFFFDVGAYGEKLTIKVLKKLNDPDAKILNNIYLLKNNNDETTEIDILMIRSSGIYVLESKNYSGWIFGSTKGRYWTQTLPGKGKKRKNSFLNPIHQNSLHIRCIKEYLGLDETSGISVHSIIVFSKRCTFKNVNVKDSDAFVIRRPSLKNTMLKIHNSEATTLTPDKIEELHQKLLSCTNVSDEVKEKHIQDIKAKHLGKK